MTDIIRHCCRLRRVPLWLQYKLRWANKIELLKEVIVITYYQLQCPIRSNIIGNVAAFHFQVPIIPVVFSHYHNMDFHEKIILPNIATITVLESINTVGKHPVKDLRDIMESTRQNMLKAFVNSSSWATCKFYIQCIVIYYLQHVIIAKYVDHNLYFLFLFSHGIFSFPI